MAKRKPDEAEYTFQVFRCDNPDCQLIHLNITMGEEFVTVPIPDDIWNALMVDVANLQKGTVN